MRQAEHQVYGLTRDDSKPRAKELQKYEVNITLGDIKHPETYCKYLENSDVISVGNSFIKKLLYFSTKVLGIYGWIIAKETTSSDRLHSG